MKKSLHIGLNGVDPNAYGGWPGWLNACVNDARDLASLCARAGFEAHAAFNEEATITRLRTELQAAAAEMASGDVFLLSYSGHGGRSDAWAMNSYTETICLYDGELADTALREFLAAFVPGVKIVLLMDSCYSGGLDRDANRRSRSKPRFVKSGVREATSAIPVMASVVLNAACRADETAQDGDVNGAFTAALLKVAETCENEGKSLTWNGWMKGVQSLMLRDMAQQHPVAVSFGSTADWNFDVTSG